MEIALLHEIFLQSSGVSTDTRSIEENSLFFALQGENFNANAFAAEALEKGASRVVIDEPSYALDQRYILVENALSSLQELATFHRRHLNIPIIAITGSNGKTTTKELSREVLATKFQVRATEGNLNNHIGVPLTLLSLDESVEIGIVEMGANHRGEIAFLAGIAQPDLGYITNFGKAHLEGFGGYEGVIAGKSELYDFLKKKGKKIIFNYDDPIQRKQQAYGNTFSFGTASDPEVDLTITYPTNGEYARIQVETKPINSQLIGRYNALNMAAAVALGFQFKIPIEAAKTAIEAYKPKNNRSQIMERNGAKIILDAYNANPTSMAAALDNFMQRTEPYKIAILGDMFELGPTAMEEHQAVADRLGLSDIDQIILVGKHFYGTMTHERIHRYHNIEELQHDFPLLLQLKKDALILIKGSRAMALERVLKYI